MFTIIENKTLLMQKNISYFTSKFNYRGLYFNQKRLVGSLSARLLSVRDTLMSTRFFLSSNKFTAQEKLRVTFNLNLTSFSYYPEFYYLKKKSSFIKTLETLNLYYFSFSCLLNICLLPFVENKSDKFSFIFKPFYDFNDLFVYIRSLFLKDYNYRWSLQISSFSHFNFSRESQLMKYLPFLKISFENYLFNRNFNTFLDNNYSLEFRKDVKFTIFNYMLSGLLWIL